MFEIAFVVMCLILLVYAKVNSKRAKTILPILLFVYSVFLILLKYLEWRIPTPLLLIIFFVAFFVSLWNFVLGFLICGLSIKNHTFKNRKEKRDEKLAQDFGWLLVIVGAISFIKTVFLVTPIINQI